MSRHQARVNVSVRVKPMCMLREKITLGLGLIEKKTGCVQAAAHPGQEEGLIAQSEPSATKEDACKEEEGLIAQPEPGATNEDAVRMPPGCSAAHTPLQLNVTASDEPQSKAQIFRQEEGIVRTGESSPRML